MEKKSTRQDGDFAGRLYGSYLKTKRLQRGIKGKQISRGVCAGSTLAEIEQGEKSTNWLLRERLLQRVGVARDAYADYLDYEEYAEWKSQREILKALERKDTEEMAMLLEKYAKDYLEKKDIGKGGEKEVFRRLRRQFYLGMKGIYRKLCAAPKEELEKIFDEAVHLTVPELEEKPIRSLVLCPEEINLILEYTQCLPFCEALRWCKKIENYLRDTQGDDWVRVLNYPKVILLLCQMLSEQGKEEEGFRKYVQIIRLCDSGIVLLQKTQKAYYLEELLELKNQAVHWIQEWNRKNGKAQAAASLEGMCVEIEERWKCFDELHERFNVQKGQNSDIWLYVMQDMYCIGDVIRIRRKMLGMTQKELYYGICSQDTLRRLERREVSTQPAIVWELCRRLGLSPECERTELVTGNPDAQELEREIRYVANEGKFEENLVWIEKLKGMIDVSDEINRQWLLRMEGMAKYRIGQIDRKEYEKWIRRAFECTLPWSVLELADEKECYLTNSEMACIYHLSLLDFPEKPQEAYEKMKIVFRVEHEFEEKGEAGEHIRSYELYEKYEAQIWNQLGEYEKSKEYAEKVLSLCLRMGRVNMLDGAFYEWVRSRVKLVGKEEEPEREGYNWKRDLQYCLVLSRFCYDSIREKFLMGILSDQETQ